MILPKHKLKDFSYFTIDYEHGTDKSYNSTCHDIITVFYYKEKSIFGLGYKKEWSTKYKFKRISRSGSWESVSGVTQFVEQLNGIVDDTWTYIDPAIYGRIKIEHPEYFL